MVRGLVGYVAHESLAFPSLTIGENLSFFAALHGVSSRPWESLVRAAGLWPLRNRPVATLSRGQLQRLALCRAALHDPPVLLMDEPHSGLDPAAAAELDLMLVGLAGTIYGIFWHQNLLMQVNQALQTGNSVWRVTEMRFLTSLLGLSMFFSGMLVAALGQLLLVFADLANHTRETNLLLRSFRSRGRPASRRLKSSRYEDDEPVG